MTNSMGEMTNRQLLATIDEAQQHLRDRGLIRSANSALGDFAEHVAMQMHPGSTQETNSTAGFDITTAKGKTIQVKARRVGTRGGFSPIDPKKHADLYLFFLFAEDWVTVTCWELPGSAVVGLSTPRTGAAHTGKILVSRAKVKESDKARDRSTEAQEALDALLTGRG